MSAATLRLGDRLVELRPGHPLVMGIVNASPDSFSDAVRRTTLDAQVEHALRLAADGADLVDVVGDVLAFLRERCTVARDRGVADEQLVLDPGPDFAKRPAETVAVLRALDRLRTELGRPVLAAVSRKYVLGAITGRPPGERLPATLAALGAAVRQGAGIVRVHDVAAAVDYLRTWRVLAGLEELGDFDEDDDRLKWIRATR